MIDDAGVLLSGTAQEARNVHEGQDLDVERIAETNETRCLAAGITIEHTRKMGGLVRDDTGRATVETRKAADDILGKIFMDFEEVAVIHDRIDDLVHVVGLVGVVGHNLVEDIVHAGNIVRARITRGFLHVVLRNEGDETTHFGECLFFRSCHEMGYAGLGSVDMCAAELLNGHVFACNGFDYFRTGDEHITVLLGHHDKVRERRAIYCPTRAGTEDDADLRDDAGREDVTLEDLTVAGKRTSAFLNTCAA